jgi:hypothetical protein
MTNQNELIQGLPMIPRDEDGPFSYRSKAISRGASGPMFSLQRFIKLKSRAILTWGTLTTTTG